ncbi:MAG: SAF domain-containing protein [Actinomycetota bacterium]|nr:SAF domain-containing protein [Actinomycetota bacterium]
MNTGTRLRSRVRAQWLALAAALVVLAGVLVAWALTDAADRVSVVQVARAVPAGAVISEDDLTVAGVAFDQGVHGLVPAESLAALVGRTASVDLRAGSLVVTGMWREGPQLAPGEHEVGALIDQGRFPDGLTRGDGALAAPIDATLGIGATSVRVMHVEVAADGDLAVTLAVPSEFAVAVAQLAASGQLLLIGHDAGVDT